MFTPLGPNTLVSEGILWGPFAPYAGHQTVSFAVLGYWFKRDIAYSSAESMRACGSFEGVYE